MITANSKVTAVEILTELGVKNADKVFGKMRVRIGGIAGINKATRVINIPASVKKIEVIVGSDLYELELAAGRKEIADISEGARATLDAEGKEASQAAVELQKAKDLARKIRDMQDSEQEYTPTKAEEPYVEKAIEIVEAGREAEEAAKKASKPQAIKVKSK